jgi:pimeloyl-ACP methyl ester carboxylesterase
MSTLAYTEYGSGQAVVLLHGFPFNKDIWNGFAKQLSSSFYVYTLDLPGFGGSPLPHSTITLDQVGESINDWVIATKLDNPVLIGHSLGGYVALAAVKKRPDLFSALGLFHSTAFADSEEKKQSRTKVLEFIERNGVEAFTSNFIGPLFVTHDHPAISRVRSVAMQSKTEAVKAYTRAMRDRSERTDVLRTFDKPILFLAGEQDPGISVDSIRNQAAISAKSEVNLLPETAHMGMFEKEKECLEIIRTFVEKSTVTK